MVNNDAAVVHIEYTKVLIIEKFNSKLFIPRFSAFDLLIKPLKFINTTKNNPLNSPLKRQPYLLCSSQFPSYKN